MREGYGSRSFCLSVCLSICLSVTTLAATYLVCESNFRCCKVPYGVPNAWFVWISPKTLRSPVLASFADSKLLDLSRASDSITSRINRTLCVTRYIRYVRINACAVGTVAIIGSSSLAGELLLLRRGFCTIVLHWTWINDRGGINNDGVLHVLEYIKVP